MKTSNMDYEKKYKEALEKIRSLHRDYNQISSLIDVKEELENIFPELAESEDERMIRVIMNALTKVPYSELDGLIPDTIRIWIERKFKQGEQKEDNPPFNDPKYLAGFDTGREVQKIFDEQKSTDWSNEDELHIKELESLVKQVWAIAEHENDKDTIHKMSDLSFFLKTLIPQPKQDWSEEDEERYESCLQKLGSGNPEQPETINSKWFKEHVYPQSRWKPSATDIQVLEYVIDRGVNPINYHATLHGILEQLKKLREEWL